jgi:hypothetical protein
MSFIMILARVARCLQVAGVFLASAAASGESVATLARGREWLKLLHYEADGDGFASRIDSPDFFLTAAGAREPAAELQAAVAASTSRDGALELVCRFPARAAFIKSHLAPEMPFEPCPTLRHWVETLDAPMVSILFASQYSGNPASRFGHTFLRFEKEHRYGERMLASTDPIVSYAAIIAEVNPLEYAWNGLFGGFKGYFSVSTLGETLRDYANMEDRALWDYPVELTAEERQRLALHLYELRGIWSWYWFTSENCSFQLIAVLEAARPELDLLEGFHAYFLPIDTVQMLMERGLVRKARYFPSSGDKFRRAVGRLDGSQREDFVRALEGGELPPGAEAPVLNALIYYADYRYADKKAMSQALISLQEEALAQRARLPRESAATNGITPARAPPHQAVGLALVETGIGAGTEGPFASLRWRPLAHDLLNSDEGLTPNEELSVLDTRLRYEYRTRRFDLYELILLRNVVLDPLTFYRRALSWDLEASLRRTNDYGEGRGTSLRLDPRGGLSFGLDSGTVGFAMLSYFGEASLGRGTGVVSGPRAHFGLLTSGGPYKAQLVYRLMQSVTGSTPGRMGQEIEAAVAAGWARNRQISAAAVARDTFGVRAAEVTVDLALLF